MKMCTIKDNKWEIFYETDQDKMMLEVIGTPSLLEITHEFYDYINSQCEEHHWLKAHISCFYPFYMDINGSDKIFAVQVKKDGTIHFKIENLQLSSSLQILVDFLEGKKVKPISEKKPYSVCALEIS